MNFNSLFLKSFRLLLLPFALLYGVIVIIRNILYDKKILRSSEFNFPLICVGNLSVGGTGKSPMVEYLIQLLRPHFKVATVSRGYKRKTKGYVLAKDNTTALEIGDEPMQFHINFPDIAVAVGEERIVAIPQLLHDKPDTQAIILDDAFQHREVRAGLNILLTQYDDLFTNDFFLPTGDLRDQKASYQRADVIIVTKCPATITDDARKEIINEIEPLAHQKIFFTAIEYGVPYHISNHSFRKISNEDEVLLVCGIANPKPLKDYIFDNAATYYQMDYSDHHIFRIDDLKDIRKKYEGITADKKMIITTEKDAVRLIKFTEELRDMHLYVLPIRHKFLFNAGSEFDELVVNFIRNFKMREEVVEE
ncbi:tetraacyldisaccharide 4'-kinase [Panacibacter ginsenosidivorans]|uniref:Tetraacyldisaccharide 4'-kinase n=1 Tax=Panacibacter ginsenosidivorans TaxID=1813871 RepID=A0A5B8V8U4_9BACT|nr:tetraacyldisaccharide 4'-kinase [Panacibacter ginsenosidivorans]QEC67333.1 tetraacyldisaccharide 4'-kinase [Panacibacter ginsenosidivorans]